MRADLSSPTALFKCLADDTRLRMTLLISQAGELCVCELMAALDEAQPKISRHLALLRSSGLLADRRQGQWVYYRLHPELPSWANEMLKTVLAANGDWLAPNQQRLEAMRHRPERVNLCL